MSALKNVRAWAIRFRAQSDKADTARLKLRDAIEDARSEGATLSQIADMAGVSPQRIEQILKKSLKGA